jgi:ABC-type branched-subunit amino acid transport system ATPase component
VLEAGRCVLEGPSAELEQNELVRTAYLGGGLEIA